jgi:hypothetical protein
LQLIRRTPFDEIAIAARSSGVFGFHVKPITALPAAESEVRQERRFDVISFVVPIGRSFMLQLVHLQGKHHLPDLLLKGLPFYKRFRLTELIRKCLKAS